MSASPTGLNPLIEQVRAYLEDAAALMEPDLQKIEDSICEHMDVFGGKGAGEEARYYIHKMIREQARKMLAERLFSRIDKPEDS